VNDVKPRTYAALFNRNVIVFGQKESTVAQTLDVLARKAPGLAADSAFAQLCAASDNSFVQAMARKIELPNNDPNAAVFRLAKLIRLKVGEASRQITASLVLEANDDQIANQITSIVQGLTSLLKLQDKKPEAAKLANALTIHQSGVSVTVNLSLPADDVVGMMKADAAKKALKNAETKIQTH
jgi:molybdopterin-biosynthesis enzyme MoeA-like protein